MRGADRGRTPSSPAREYASSSLRKMVRSTDDCVRSSLPAMVYLWPSIEICDDTSPCIACPDYLTRFKRMIQWLFQPLRFQYGMGTDIPIVGNFNNDGIMDIGVFRMGQVMLKEKIERVV